MIYKMFEIDENGDSGRQNTTYEDIPVDNYDASNVNPVFYGRFPKPNSHIRDSNKVHVSASFGTIQQSDNKEDSSVTHPATFGSVLLHKMPVEDRESTKALSDPRNCSAREYVENYIYPLLSPALEELLAEAKNNKVFEKRRTKFNACDFLTTYLYNHNPRHGDTRTTDVCLEEIPFVQEILAVNPRPPIPLSLLLSDDEAATIVQAHYRGYQVRKDPEVHELREYQREMREEEVDINFRVEDFWKKRSMENVE